MSKMKCPPCLLKTTKAFLSNRQSRVRFEGKTSHYKKFTGGVPQGGVLSPTLFLIFINDISSNLPEGVEVSLFADDLALLAQNEDLEQASSLLHRQNLETVQNAAARTITGCTKSTNTKLLLSEAKLLPLEVESTISQSAAYERSLRLPETEPSRKTAENPVRTRLRSLGTWRETGKDKA
ncbi:RNA-directed DNA polymerase from mobile element jockey [Elysia marginata]|uniref:RNA-directed DNA polymerase from mobile element jockey n=1 Tax=Elysia marginata TaxID=1093978 RepID=A0AAV4EBJ8_9GAST|nr:RNA-directed DNA polymerase from mobile element jockey [Elysia marginata]